MMLYENTRTVYDLVHNAAAEHGDRVFLQYEENEIIFRVTYKEFADECDAIAACVIGGVSFVGGTGKISGVVLGVFLLRIIFVALNFLSINQNLQYIIKGLIILVACSIDMRKYLVRK